MSIEQALIVRGQPHMVASRLRHIISQEISKGCLPEISPHPVALEPRFNPIWKTDGCLTAQNQSHWVSENPIARKDLVRLEVWISPDQKFDWVASELFIKQLEALSFRVGFEVAGNNKRITISFLIHRADLPVITAAFNGEFEFCELTHLGKGPLDTLTKHQWPDIVFRDYFPAPPYSHLLTRPYELQISPLNPLITALSTIKEPAVGLYQALLDPVAPHHNVQRNIEILVDLEFNVKLQSQSTFSQKFAQQAPSGDLHQMAGDVESKAHNDKPFYAMVLRLAVIGAREKRTDMLAALATFTHLFQHGGRPLGYVTEKEYAKVLSSRRIQDMFLMGLTHRPGFLVNSLELTGPVHIPSLSASEQRPVTMQALEILPVRNPDLLAGTWIGTCDYAGESRKVCIPNDMRKRHTHLIGATGVGKSTTEEHMILGDIDQGHGVAVIDPHGDMVERLLGLIPEHHVGRTVYLNPGDPDWVPIWNPLDSAAQDLGRTANDLVTAIKSFVTGGGWGDRLENILRNMIFGILHLSGGTFLDISNLLRNKSKKNDMLVLRILKVIDNPTARQFWLHDYKGFGKNDLGPPINKLSKLLISGTVSLMLSQPENRFNFRSIMDSGKILLIDLSNMGVSVRKVLGCFILSILHLNALSRRDLPINERGQFHIYCDEAHNFFSDTIDSIIAEARKYSVSLNLANQYMSQFSSNKRDALSTVASAIIFKVDKRDAEYLAKDLQGKVKPEDLMSLERGEAFARIGSDVVRIETRLPLDIPTENFRDQIIEESRRQFYRPVHEVRKLIKQDGNKWGDGSSSVLPLSNKNVDSAEFVYDEFEE